MKEYTILAVVSVIATIASDNLLGTRLLKRKIFILFLCLIAGFKIAVNGVLTGEGIVQYNPRMFMGIRLGSIPVEDFLFGFSMVTLSIIIWELFKDKRV